MFFKKKKRFMVIGIDGVPYELIKEYSDKGYLPNFKKLIENNKFIKTQVPVPEISSVSWTSFMTAKNPGEHGVFGFMEINPQTYAYKFLSFKTLQEKTMWERLEEKKKRSIIINLPNTYPAKPINGYLISGFVALDLKDSVYPKTYLKELEKINYRVDVDVSLGKKDKKHFLRDLHETLDIRFDVYKRLVKTKWDLFYFIITGTDRLHHFLFKASDNENHPYNRDFIDYYKKVDKIIGEITDDMNKKGIPFIILSDHGFVKLEKEIYLSQYLKKWGFLEFDLENPKDIKSINENSKVFALDPSRIYIHLKDKYKRGNVKKEDYEPIRKDIKQMFSEIEIEGKRVFKNIFYKEEIYKGRFFDLAPDIVLLSNYGFDLKAGITKNTLYSESDFEGMHSQDNALLIDSFDLGINDQDFIYKIGQKIEKYF